jgi:putative FmdB family regulatory protein
VAVPLYEYKCVKCGRRTEKIESVSGPHLKKCPHCGGKVESLISAPAIQFKGSGWYVTDYAGKSAPGESAGKDGKDGKPAEQAEKKDAAKDSSAKDSGAKQPSAPDTKPNKSTKNK